MIGLPSAVKISLSTEPVDMRKGFDSLAGLVRRGGGEPFSGHLYVFVSRRRDRVLRRPPHGSSLTFSLHVPCQ